MKIGASLEKEWLNFQSLKVRDFFSHLEWQFILKDLENI